MVIGITETKLDISIGESEIAIDGYCAIRHDRNRKDGGVICYVTKRIFYNTKNCISNEIENIFVELLIPKTRPITAGIVYKPPDQTRFLEILSNSLNWLNILSKEWHILGDLNISLYQNGSTLGEENKNIIKDANKVSSQTKKYLEFWKAFGLKQLIKSPNRVTPNTSTVIDHIDKYEWKNYTIWINQYWIVRSSNNFLRKKLKKKK